MTMTDVRPKINDLEDALNAEHFERRPEIHSIVLALLAEQHVFLLGSHGLAKSQLLRRLVGWIHGARFFKLQLNPYHEPETLNGPLDFIALEQTGRRVHLIDGYLPGVEFALLDEFWEAAPGLLKSLNSILNEGEFENGNEVIPVPLVMAMLASNRLPDFSDPGMVATYDRILIRHEVGRPKDRRTLKKILQLELPPQDTPILTFPEIVLAQEAAARVAVSSEVDDAICDLNDMMVENEIYPSPRRLRELRRLIRAEAYLDGCDTCGVEHMRIAEHVLWDHPDQKAVVAAAVRELASPLETEANNLLALINQYDQRISEILEKAKPQRRKAAREIHVKLSQVTADLIGLRGRAGRRYGDLMHHVGDRLYTVLARMLTEIFELDESQVEEAVGSLEQQMAV